MLKLMKYEFRKTLVSKMILLAITAVLEVVFLIGIFSEMETPLAMGTIGLMLCGIFGILYIGIESITVFHKDLNTKQSYMLFLTPNNSFKILGAKVLENGISLVLTGVFFAVLAAIDISTAILYIGGLEELLDLLKQMSIAFSVNINVTAEAFVILFFTAIASWIMTIVTADFAVVLSATVFAGKKFSGVVSFAIFLAVNAVGSKIMEILPLVENDYLQFVLNIGVLFGIAAVLYVIAAWIMDKKLSV